MIFLPSLGHTTYSEVYDKELNLLAVTGPEIAIKTIQQRLGQAQAIENPEERLMLLFYMAEAYATLSKGNEADIVIIKGLLLAKEQKNAQFITEFTGMQTYQMLLKGLFREALDNANKSLQLAKETGDDRLYASQLALRGQAYLSIENYNLAMKDTEAAIQIFKQHNDRQQLNIYYNLLAIIYDSTGNFDKAIRYYMESLEFDDTNSLYNQAAITFNIGSAHSYKGDNEAAIENFNKSMEISYQINDFATIAYIQHGLAEIYFDQKNLKKAEEMILLALKWFKENNDLMMYFNSNLMLAKLNTDNQSYIGALAYLDLAEEQLNILDTPRSTLSYLKLKSDYFITQNMWQEAHGLSQQSIEVRAELYAAEKESSFDEAKMKFDIQFDQEKLEHLEKENQFQQEAIEHEQSKQQYFIYLTLFAFITVIVTYLSYRNQRKIKRSLFQLTIKDDLTQIANRRHILDSLAILHEASIKQQLSYALVMVDLDHFKNINDEYGHAKGNDVLIHFATVAKHSLPTEGQVGRLGGEEWLLLLPNYAQQQCTSLLNKIRLAYDMPHSLNLPNDCHLQFSSGIIINNGQHTNVEDILKLVDKTMYQAKSNGRNQDVYY